MHKGEYLNIIDLKNYGALCINSDELEQIVEYLLLVESLISIYNDRINKQEYTIDYSSKNWTRFSENDLVTIKNELTQ